MAIEMTREQYQAKYGVAPSVPSTAKKETFNNNVAPVTMTRAEYEARYRPVEPKLDYKQRILNEAQKQTDWFTNLRNKVIEWPSTIIPTLKESLGYRVEQSKQAIKDEAAPIAGVQVGANIVGGVGDILGETIGKPITAVFGTIASPIIEKYGNELAKDASKPLEAMYEVKNKLNTTAIDYAKKSMEETDPVKKQQYVDLSKQITSEANNVQTSVDEYQKRLASGGRWAEVVRDVAPWLLPLASPKVKPVEPTVKVGDRTLTHPEMQQPAVREYINSLPVDQQAIASAFDNKWNLFEQIKAQGALGKDVTDLVDMYKAQYGDLPASRATIPKQTGLNTNVNESIAGAIESASKLIKEVRNESLTNKIVTELTDIENNYVKLSKANEYSKDAGAASRRRIAQTDVLVNAVDSEGKLNTTQKGGAVDQYRAATIDGLESVVRDNLVRLDEKVNLEQVKKDLTLAAYNSKLEGADLITALNGVEKEIAGLRLKADPLGNIPVYVIHDAKINTTRNIDFNTPPEIKTYRKAIASGYKEIVENNSKFNVKEVNAELAKYYEDIERLQNLNGKRVKGGRLGKYFAQVSGNIVGGAAGSVFGPAGAAIGSAIGGEAAGYLKGKAMESTFGRLREITPEENAVLAKARQEAGLPPVKDLKTPDVKLGVPKGITKTKEVYSLEKQIADNVEMQKKAIKAGDFTLVAKLKEIYSYLVEKLKAVVKQIKETPNKQGGFARNPFAKAETAKNITKLIDDNIAGNIDELLGKAEEAVTKVKGKTDIEDLAVLEKIKEDVVKGNLTPEQRLSFNEIARRLNREDLIYSNNLGNLKVTYHNVTAKNKNVAIPKTTTETPTSSSLSNKAQEIVKTGEQKPTLQLKRDVTVTTLSGEKVVIPEAEVLKAYESGGKALLKDGREYIVSKNQYENIKNNSLKAEAKEFAPELKQTEETVKKQSPITQEDIYRKFDSGEITREQRNNLLDKLGIEKTKYAQYTLPGGKNYKEILIQQLSKRKTLDEVSIEKYGKPFGELSGREQVGAEAAYAKQPTKKTVGTWDDEGKPADYTYLESRNGKEIPSFRSSHWDEPNVLAHLRLNERTYNGKKVTFMEELQSDWAREGRSKGFTDNPKIKELQTLRNALEKEKAAINEEARPYFSKGKDAPTELIDRHSSVGNRLSKVRDELGKLEDSSVPNNPLLKNWQELAIKRALKDAVDNGSDYFAWINGEQTSARYNLATKVDEIKWGKADPRMESTEIDIKAKDRNGNSKFFINKDGKVLNSGFGLGNISGKMLNEVLGKGLADKIMSKESGTLSGEGLKFGGEWANTLYDKQVANIVKDLTGAKIENLDLGLPVDKSTTRFIKQSGRDAGGTLTNNDLKVGLEINKEGSGDYIITDVLGDGKFKAIPKENTGSRSKFSEESNPIKIKEGLYISNNPALIETFDISTKKSTGQQGIRLTPEIISKIKGEAPKLK